MIVIYTRAKKSTQLQSSVGPASQLFSPLGNQFESNKDFDEFYCVPLFCCSLNGFGIYFFAVASLSAQFFLITHIVSCHEASITVSAYIKSSQLCV